MKAILFDLDETIILDEPVTHEALRSVAAVAAVRHRADPARLAAAALASAKHRWDQSPYRAYTESIGHSAPEGLWANYDQGGDPNIHGLRQWAPGYRVAIWEEAMAEQGIHDPALAAELAGLYHAARRKYPRYPEIDAVLEALRPHYLLGIVTNGVPDLQQEKLAGSEVAHLFQAAVVSGQIGIGKPDARIFLHICGELGVEPHQCVMVGDNPPRDIAGALAAGMKSVWVERKGGKPRDERFQADLDCTDLREMLPWLEQL